MKRRLVLLGIIAVAAYVAHSALWAYREDHQGRYAAPAPEPDFSALDAID